MRRIFLLASVCFLILTAGAQSLPYVFNKENTANMNRHVSLPLMTELPRIETLPDPFLWADGSGRATDFKNWERHRSEILQRLYHYEIGQKPVVRKKDVKAQMLGDTLVVDVSVGKETLRLKAFIHYPEGDGPFPAVIGIGQPYGSMPRELFESRGVAGIAFQFTQVMSHTQKRGEEPINRLYPELTAMGAYAAWPWGVSRIIDGLEKVGKKSRIDMKRLAVTGCSFAGKMALFSGALDERIALTIAQEPGGGGVNAWRVSETKGNVERVRNTNYAWFLETMKQFEDDNVARMPIDHHQLAALIAPRALLMLGNPDYEWLCDESGYVSANAARKVWRQFGIADRMGFSIVGGHSHCQLPESQYAEVGAFIDRFLLGKNADTNIARADMFRHVDWRKWAPWAK